MLIKNGRIHDGKGRVYVSDLQIRDSLIVQIGPDLAPEENEEVIDAAGMEILPGFIHTLSFWGINGSATEIRPSSNDNDELSDPITPHLDVRYAFNGRAATTQQLGAFGLTTVGVTPTDNNVFGGTMAVFEVHGVNPFSMCLKPYAGMKASVCKRIKDIYGKRPAAPMTKMWIFAQLEEQLRLAAEYKKKADEKDEKAAEAQKSDEAQTAVDGNAAVSSAADGAPANDQSSAKDAPAADSKPRDMKLEALVRVLTGELPLFISIDNEQDALHVLDITKPYREDPWNLKLILCNGYGISKDSEWILKENIPLVVRSSSMTMDDVAMALDLKGIAALAEKGLTVALSGVDSSFQIREDVLWLGIAMMKILKDENKILPMMTSIPAKLLGVDDQTGSIEEGKRADLVLWSANPLETYQAQIITTYMGGRAIYRKGDELRCM